MTDVFRKIAIILVAIGIIICLGIAGHKVYVDWSAEKEFDVLQQEMAAADNHGDDNAPVENAYLLKDSDGAMLYTPPESLLELMAEHPDVKGWIRIKDTKIDYPILQNAEDDLYYMHRDINGKYSNPGCIFLKMGHNLDGYALHTLFGHHMKNGTMFKGIEKYYDKKAKGLDAEYAAAHSDIVVLTANEMIVLEPVACCQSVEDKDFYQVIESQSAAGSMLSAKTGTELSAGNYFVLVTCAYYTKDARTYFICRETKRYR